VWQAESFLISLCKVDFQNWINVCIKTWNIFIQNRIWDLVWKSFPRLKLQGWLFTFPGSRLPPHRTALGLSRFKRNINIRQSFCIEGGIYYTTDYIRHVVVFNPMKYDTIRVYASVVLQVSINLHFRKNKKAFKYYYYFLLVRILCFN